MHQILTRTLWSALALVSLTACTLNTPSVVEPMTISGAPVVQLAAPRSGARFLEGVAVNIQALVSNAGADIDRVEIAVGDTIIATVPTPNPSGAAAFPLISAWTAGSAGSYVISVTAFRADGSSSDPAAAEITVVGSGGGQPEEDSDDDEAEATEAVEAAEAEVAATEAPSDEDSASAQSADEDEGEEEDSSDEDSGGSGAPVATFNVGTNVRRGPSTVFDPPLGGIPAGQTAELLARSPDGAWYKIRYYNADGWIAASLVSVEGNVNGLPVDAGPATPLPVTATPIPPTPAPQPTQAPQQQSSGAAQPSAPDAPDGDADIVAGNIYLSDDSPACGSSFTVSVDIANLGSEDSSDSGRFKVRSVHIASGTVGAEASGEIPEIGEGETVRSSEIPLIVNIFYGERHRIEIVLNDNGEIAESSTGNNVKTLEYTLEQGDC